MEGGPAGTKNGTSQRHCRAAAGSRVVCQRANKARLARLKRRSEERGRCQRIAALLLRGKPASTTVIRTNDEPHAITRHPYSVGWLFRHFGQQLLGGLKCHLAHNHPLLRLNVLSSYDPLMFYLGSLSKNSPKMPDMASPANH